MSTKLKSGSGEKPATAGEQEQVSLFQLFLLFLSLAVIVSVIVDTVVPVGAEVSKILQGLDFSICVIFMVDFVVRFRRAPDKIAFMKTGWIDLVSSIPNIDILRLGRLVRVLRIIQVLRGLRAGHRVMQIIFAHRPKSALASIVATTILIVAFSSIAILVTETGSDANIKTAEDAIWWSVTTITTVGYGDRYPTTTEGRIVAVVLMLSGVGLFGTLSGVVASLFLHQEEKETSAELKEILLKIDCLETALRSVPTSLSTGLVKQPKDLKDGEP